jgi:uncharacterized GH25 family protein
MRSARRSAVIAVVLLLAAAADAAAHHVFIMPQKFRVSKGDPVTIGFHSSDGFPDSEVLLTRIDEPTVFTADGAVGIGNVHPSGKRLAGTILVMNTGHLLVTGVVPTATATMKPAAFLKYLQEEGLTDVIEARARSGEVDKPAKERFSAYAKSILLSSDPPNQGYRAVLGLTLEMVPEKDPYQLAAGEPLPVRVIFRGAPARNLEIGAIMKGGKEFSVGKTDDSGRINVPVTPGQWRLHAIHMERSTKPDADWESFWATLTFETGPPAKGAASR